MTDETPNGGFVRVSNRELFDGLQRVEREVFGMRLDLTNILNENTELRKRVRSLELKYYSVLGGLVAGVSAVGVLIERLH